MTDSILERCLRLQKIMSEIEPENPHFMVKVAYFYARLDQFNDAVSAMESALEIDPDNKDYQQTLNHYKSLLQ